jgi:hypothetical protein
LPTSPHTFIRVFGSWQAALGQAGLLERRLSGAARGMTGPAGKYEPDVLLADLRDAHACVNNRHETPHGRQSLSMAAYSRWRREEAIQTGRLVATSATIAERFGSWRAALEVAGLMSGEAAAESRPAAAAFTRDEALHAAACMVRNLGECPSRTQFVRCRSSELRRRGVPARSRGVLPSDTVLMRLFGTWELFLDALYAHQNDLPLRRRRPSRWHAAVAASASETTGANSEHDDQKRSHERQS